MDKNFKVGQSNEVVVNDIVYDLHNVYQLGNLSYDGNKLVLEFYSLENENTGPEKLNLLFEGVDFIQISDELKINRYWAIEELGYKEIDDYDDEWLLLESQASNTAHIFLRLVGGGFIRIHSKTATLALDN